MNRTLAGQMANIDDHCRLAFPTDILKAMPWWRDETIDVIVEAFRPGELRVHTAQPIASALERAVAAALADEEFDRAAVLADRYRAGTLYKEKRLPLAKELIAALRVDFGKKSQVFVTPVKSWLEVVSIDVRHGRLDDHLRFPPIAYEV